MNMISLLRQRVVTQGIATISIEEYNKLQTEWITRVRLQLVTPVIVPVEILNKLDAICIDGCTCVTKTPVPKHHKPNCHYRLATEVIELLTNTLPDAVLSGG